MWNYRIFFENLNLINKKYKLLNSNQENFNIFSILRNEYDEVNLHSRFLVELLKNKNYGKKILELFLEKLGVEGIKVKKYQVFSEYSVKQNGRIDILLKLYSNEKRKIIIIENKIYAGDQYEQLKRYYDSMRLEGYQDDEIELVYLTLYGEEPNEYSIKGLSKEKIDEIKIISYKDDIINWIENSIKETAEVPIIRETLIQYRSLLVRLTGKEEKNLEEELKNMILSNGEYLDILYKLPDVLENIKVELQLKFWEKLEERLNSSLGKKGIVIEKNFKNSNYHFSKTLIEKYYKNVRNNKYYGLMYFIKKIENTKYLYLRIEICHNIYYGFRILGENREYFNHSNSLDNYLKSIREKLLILNFESDENWLGWKYIYNPKNLNQTLNFKEMNKELALLLNNDDELENLISKIEKEIIEKLEILFEE